MTTPSRTARRGSVLRNVGWLTAAAMLALAALAPAAHAASVTPTPINSGNPTCTSFDPSWTQFKLEGAALADGTYTDGTLQVTITGYTGSVSGTPGSFDWTSNIGVDAVFVKAGSIRHNLFVYVPESTGDTDLGPQAGLGNGISHISFCYDVALATDQPTDAPTDSATDQPTDAPTDSATDQPTDAPSSAATDQPTDSSLSAGAAQPTDSPTDSPTDQPTDGSLSAGAAQPTDSPTDQPTDSPTDSATDQPIDGSLSSGASQPTNSPTDQPTDAPTDSATDQPIDGSVSAGAAQPVSTDEFTGEVAGITGVPGMTPPPTDTSVPVQVPSGDGWRLALICLAAVLIGGLASSQPRRARRAR